DDRAVPHDHAADRHFAALPRGFRLGQRQLHEIRFRHARFQRAFMLLAFDIAHRTRMTGPQKNKKPQPGERIAKVMARAGLCSRRDAESWIAAGRVTVNGRLLASPAFNVKPGDTVTVDGQPLPLRERTRLFRYHKPRGLMTTDRDPRGRPTLFEKLPKGL